MKKLLQQTLCLTSAVALVLSLVLAGCSQESDPDAADSAAPAVPNAIDLTINHYEKTVKEYVRVAKKHRGGDVSLTMKYIDLDKGVQAEAAQLQQQAAQMTPVQNRRVAKLTAQAAPYLQH